MINENTYFIGMSFISWTVAIFMTFGFIQLQSMKEVANSESAEDTIRLMAEAFVNQFNEMNFSEKVINIMYYGALTIALMLLDILKVLKKAMKKKEKKKK